MAHRPNQVSIPNPEFGVDFDASARAMHQSASKGSLMVHEKAFSMPAVARKSLAATMFERNTMLKTLKRKIALVAVAGLGFGVISTVPAFAAATVPTATVGYVGRIGLDADASGAADTKYTLATTTMTDDAGVDDTIALALTSGPAGGALTVIDIGACAWSAGNVVTVGGAEITFQETDSDGAGADCGATIGANPTITGLANLPGVYKLRIGGAAAGVTATITVGTAPTTLTFDKTAYTGAPGVSLNVVATPKDSAGRTTLLSGTEAVALTSSDATVTIDALAGSGRLVATGVNAAANGVVAQTAATGAFTLPIIDSTIGTATLTFDSTAGLIVSGAAVLAQTTAKVTVIAASLTEITSAKITNTGTIAGTALTTAVGEVKKVKAPTDGVFTLTGTVGGLTPSSTKVIRIEQTGLTTPANASTIVVTADDAGVAPISISITGASDTDVIRFGVDGNASGAFNDAAGDVYATLTFEASLFTIAGGTTTTVPSFATSATLSTLAATGASASVSVTVADQFGNPGAAYLFRATSDDTVARTVSALTGLDGKASLTLAAPTDATDTSVVWTIALLAQDLATPVRIATGTNNGTLTINYTTAGKADSIVLTGAGTTVTSKTVPYDGVVSDEDTTMTATVYQGGSAITGAVVTVTAPAGCFVASADPTATNPLLSTNKATLTTTSGTAVFMWCNKTGTQTFTFESNGVTKTQAVKYVTATAGARDISLTTKDASVTATVKDLFGNGVSGASVIFTRVGNAVFAGGSTVITVPTAADGTAEAILQALGTGGKVTVTGTHSGNQAANAADAPAVGALAAVASASVDATVSATTGATATDAAVTAVKADVKAVSDTVATLSKAVTTIQSSVTELTSSFSAQIKSLSSAIAKISRAIAALSKKIK